MKRITVISAVAIIICAVSLFVPSGQVDVRQGKEFIAMWFTILFVSLFFLKNIWLKLFVIWSLIRTILGFNQFSYLTLNLIFLYAVFYQVLFDKIKSEQVKQAVETAFKVGVTGVNIITVPGKMRRIGRRQVMTQSWKKAIVTLREGDKIELFEGV